MAESHVSNEEFFTGLTKILSTRAKSGHGSIILTQKRLTYGISTASSPEDPLSDLSPKTPIPVLIRATNGKSKEHREKGEKEKLSTVVQPDALEGFFVRYADICKTGMQALKKRDRSKRKRGKDKKKVDKKG